VDALESEEEREEFPDTVPAGALEKTTIEVAIKDVDAPVNIFKELESILEARGKKNTDKQAQIDALSGLMPHATTDYQKVIVLNALIPARFDFVPSITGCMSIEMWQKYNVSNHSALKEIVLLYDILESNKHIIFGLKANDEESEANRDKMVSNGVQVTVRGSPASYVDRLDDEFFKSLLSLDPHTSEYTERLRDETLLYCVLVRAQKYAEDHCVSREILDLILLRRIEHLYYKVLCFIELANPCNRKYRKVDYFSA
jgi:translation initiation factor 3 subunit C